MLPKGMIPTDIDTDDLADRTKSAYREGRIPLGRLGQPDDRAGPFVFLASDRANHVIGAPLLSMAARS